ncbi:MAG: hypothetical protein WCO49_20680 [Nostocales cyanobacterium ELA608]
MEQLNQFMVYKNQDEHRAFVVDTFAKEKISRSASLTDERRPTHQGFSLLLNPKHSVQWSISFEVLNDYRLYNAQHQNGRCLFLQP